jgi:putative membrane protein
MSDQPDRDTGRETDRNTGHDDADDGPRPRVFVMEGSRDADTHEPAAPQVIATTQTGRVVAAAPAERPPAMVGSAPPRRRSRATRLGLLGLTAAFVGWLGIDAYLWIASVFEHSATLGWLAAAAVGAGVGGAGLITARELRGFLALRAVETNQRRIAVDYETAQAADMRDTIRNVLAVIPKDRESRNAIEAFQRKVQRHHSAAQQLELMSQTVMAPFDRRAEAIVRRASARAFGITAISPTAVTDALFFLACSVRMVREIAACYGHRPTTSATIHLLRRLMVEAGKLGAIDLAAATLTQHITGAVAERLAASAAESMYATQRMARLGLVTMELCRPIPFRQQEIPGVMSSLIGNLLARGPRAGDLDAPSP